MKRTSQRIARVDLPIIPTIAALVRDHPGTISLGQGVVSYGPPDDALAALPLRMREAGLHKYQAVSGYPPLVQALQAKLRTENGLDTTDSEVMVTAGSNMAFLTAVLAVGDPGDEFLLPMPYYFNQEMAVRMCGCVPVPVPTRADWQLDIEALERAITPRTRAIITVSPNNPSGAVYPEADLRRISALCRDRGLFHFSDEAYEYFTYDGARHFSPGAIDGAAEHTISFYSFSKNFGMASWRVGYVVYPKDLSEAMNKVQDTNVICAPVASQLLALELLSRGRAAVDARVAELAQVRRAVHAALGALGDLAEFPRTEGALYVLLKLPGLAGDPLAFNRAMAERHRVATVPGFAFGLADTRAANYQRLSYGALDGQTVAEGVARFVAAVQDWYRG